MQADRSAGTARVAGSVRGLGVCDVLRVELAPVQRAGLEDGLAVRAAALEQRKAELAAVVRERSAAEAEREQLGDASEALRLLGRMRAGLPARGLGPLTLTGPAGLVLELVDACVADAVADLAVRLREAQAGPPRSATVAAELEAAAAWIATALDCAAVDGFCFESGADPGRAW